MGCVAGTGGRSSFDRLTVKSRSSRFFLNERAHFCLSHLKVDEMSKTRMAQSREILAKIFMNRDEIKRDENGQNMFVRRCLMCSSLKRV